MEESAGAVAGQSQEPVADTSLEAAHSAFLSEAADTLDAVFGTGDGAAGAAQAAEPSVSGGPGQAGPNVTTGEPGSRQLSTDSRQPGSQPGSQPAISVNWDADDNPYKLRAAEHEAAFKGLQGRVQELTEFQRQVTADREAAQAREREAQLRDFQERMRYLTPEQQAAAKLALQGAHALTEGRQAQAAAAAEHDRVEAAAKVRAAQLIAEEIGIDPEVLMVYTTPSQMVTAANLVKAQQQALSAASAEATRQARAETGADAFIGGGSTPGVGGTPQTLEEAHKLFEKDLARFDW